ALYRSRMKWITPSLLVFLLLTACSKESPKAETPGTTPPAAKPAPAPAKVEPAKPSPAKVDAAKVDAAKVEPAKVEPAKVAPAKPAANADMDAAITTLMAKAEHNDASIEVQHILIAFQGSGVPSATRSKDEAKALAQKVYAEVIAGGDFGELVKKYTNDSAPGIYPMTKVSRRDMVQGFGDVGWRLQVGEVGVAPFDAKASKYGWHIIKRLK
ncbi:MAG: peptidylprolyl isomerase, partial [Planctomycetota bacterium]